MKLSKKQRELLTQAVNEGQVQAVDWYPPIRKLLALGLIKASDGPNSYNNRWVPTEAGCNVVGKP